jgi:hypothetical protein
LLELADAMRAAGQQVHDPPPGRVSQCFEQFRVHHGNNIFA